MTRREGEDNCGIPQPTMPSKRKEHRQRPSKTADRRSHIKKGWRKALGGRKRRVAHTRSGQEVADRCIRKSFGGSTSPRKPRGGARDHPRSSACAEKKRNPGESRQKPIDRRKESPAERRSASGEKTGTPARDPARPPHTLKRANEASASEETAAAETRNADRGPRRDGDAIATNMALDNRERRTRPEDREKREGQQHNTACNSQRLTI